MRTAQLPDQPVAENRLIRVSFLTARPVSMADNVSFEYNGLGQRVHIVEKHGDTVLADKRLLWVDSNIAEERASNGSTVNKRYFDQGYILTSGDNAGNYFYAKDHLGSIREITDSTGTVRASYDYDLWGRKTKLSGDLDSDFGFTGFYRNESSNLDLTWYRAYSADFGRWLSRDRLAESMGTNIYKYAENNMVKWVDPFGLECIGGEPINQVLNVGPEDALIGNMLADEALSVAQNATRLPGARNGMQDAFRHCYWSCRMTQVLGADTAKKIADVHEKCGGGPTRETVMDQYNNAQGRRSGECGANCFDDCMKKLIGGFLYYFTGGRK